MLVDDGDVAHHLDSCDVVLKVRVHAMAAVLSGIGEGGKVGRGGGGGRRVGAGGQGFGAG